MMYDDELDDVEHGGEEPAGQAERDARVLVKAKEILADPGRLAAAKEYARKLAAAVRGGKDE